MESKLGKLSRTNSKSFEDAARALECDESEERFDAALKKVATHKPEAKVIEGRRSARRRERE
jgi:hypothetical protein